MYYTLIFNKSDSISLRSRLDKKLQKIGNLIFGYFHIAF